MKKLIIILILSFTIGCASTTKTVNLVENETSEPVVNEQSTPPVVDTTLLLMIDIIRWMPVF